MSAAAAPTTSGSLSLDVTVAVGGFDLVLALEARPGEVVAIVGPNGAGKSTLLRCVCGLLPIDAGRIAIGDRVLDEPATGRWVEPEHRGVGVVFQDHLLFPHLSVLENVAFGLRASGRPAGAARIAATGWLERVGLGDLATRRPRELSGGQAQRVAIARALVTEPAVLLLDEPLSALDAGTRGEVRRDLRRAVDEHPGARLLVTHDPVDAQVLADRVVVVESGRIVQQGTFAEVAARPRSRYVAELVGLNLWRGTGVAGEFRTERGAVVVCAEPVPDGLVGATVRPQAVTLHRERPQGSQRNAWELRVVGIDVLGDRARVVLGGALDVVAEITPAALADLAIVPGDLAWAAVKATEVEVTLR
jgi:molybdate transport system ATP-binding protein